MSIRQVADSRFDQGSMPTLDASNRQQCAEFVARALDDRIGAVVVVGDDATLAALATAYLEDLRGRSEPLAFLPLAAGRVNTLADAVGSERVSKKTLARALRRVERGELEKRLVSTLRIVDSARSRAELGFAFGMGAVNELFEGDTRLRRRDAVKQAFRGRAMIDADVFVDWRSVAARFGYLVASSLPRTWAGVEMAEGASHRMGDSPLELVRGATRVGRIVERATGNRAANFGRIHIDTNSDYVVDGLLRRASTPRVVALTSGPQFAVFASS